MDNLPGNSHTAKVARSEVTSRPAEAQKPKIEKVVSGAVIQRKKPLGRRLKDTFIGGDAKGAAHYVAEDVVFPAVKDLIADGINTLVERIIFGDGRSGSSRRTNVGRSLVNNASQSFVSYNRFGGNPAQSTRPDPRNDPRPQLSREARRNHDFREIVLASRAEANEVIRRMQDLTERYDTCSVSDLYTMLDINPDFTDEKWGWDNLSSATAHRDGRSGGYVLMLPAPEPLA